MKMFSKSTVLSGVAAALLGLSVSAAVAAPTGFTGDYAVTNWIQTPATGSIDVTGAPNSVTLVGSNTGDGNFHDTRFTIPATGAATGSFDWVYHTDDAPLFDPAYFLNNGIQLVLSADAGAIDQSGSYSFSVGAGEVFGFSVVSADGLFGAAQLTIRNFNLVPTTPPISRLPEPGSLALLTLGLVVMVAARQRKQRRLLCS